MLEKHAKKAHAVQARVVPSKSCLSKNQLALDVAYMVWWCQNRTSMRTVDYWKADSSPQAGADIFNSEVVSIAEADIVNLWVLANDLIADDQGLHTLTKEGRSERCCEVKEALVFHKQPCMGLGSGRTSVQHKLAALIWAMSLESMHDERAHRAFPI